MAPYQFRKVANSNIFGFYYAWPADAFVTHPSTPASPGYGFVRLPGPVTLTKRTEIGADADYKNPSSL
jgi:hypothetical protein